MSQVDDKENQSPLGFGLGKSPDRKKARSKSIGPGGLELETDAPKQQSPDRNRRKSVAAPAAKSILPSREDEAKRKEARRKSLANRRVSFAPEATLHTWDVIEYMRDATTSSAASGTTRRASSTYDGPDSDPPSTPPEQADDDSELPDSPEHQRDAHQQKRRRSSAIPPMNFNDLDDYSSSPVSGSSDAAASSDVEEEVESEDDEADDGESTAMSLDQGDNTMASVESGDSTGSSARLEAALRQAAEQAGTRGIEFDEYGDMSMEMAGDEITNAFKPWSQGQHFAADGDDDDNANPFASVFQPGLQAEDDEDDMSMDMTRAVGRILPQQHFQPRQQRAQEEEEDGEEEDEGDMTMDMTKPVGSILPSRQPRFQEADESKDMTMDMTRPVGGILGFQQQQSPERTVSFGDETMDLTQAVGKIHQWNPQAQPPRSALKRRFDAVTTEEGSPLTKKTPQEEVRQAKRTRSSASRLSLGDGTMDFTMAVGSIQQRQSPPKNGRRESLRSRRSSAASSVMDEQTMEFTTAVGGIKQLSTSPKEQSTIEEETGDGYEDMSMEFTAVVGRIHQQAGLDIERPNTPRKSPNKSPSPVRTEIPTTPKDQGRFKEAHDFSAKKLLTPMFEQQAPPSAVKDSAGSRRSSALKSASPAFLSPAVVTFARKSPASAHKSPASARKTPSSALKSPRSAQKTPDFAQRTPSVQPSPASVKQNGSSHKTSSVHVSPASVKQNSSAQNTPSAQKSPASVKPNGSVQKTPSVRMSPASATQTPASVAKTSASKNSSRRSSVSTRRSARKSLAATQPQEDEPVLEAQPTPSTSPAPVVEEPNNGEVEDEHASMEEPSAQPEEEHHDEPVGEVSYPVLPVVETEPAATPISPKPQPAHSSPVHHHVAVSTTGSPRRSSAVTTPKQIDLEDVNPPSPSLEKQLRSSPVKFAATPEQTGFGSVDEPSRTFADSIKLLSTPRKDAGTSPLKRLRTLTPKKSPAKKAMTPKMIATPKFLPPTENKPNFADLAGFQIANNVFAVPKSGPPPKRIHLNEFLDLAGVKFMDLTASKRRHTTAPAPNESNGAEDETIDLEGAVVAGACTMPMLDLFQHACRELKRYISEGKSFLKTLEAEVYEEPPPFFQAYVDASPDRKAQLDGHMRDAKTNARYTSKEIWYNWRSQLLDGLEDGLNKIKEGLDADADILGQKEQAIESILPELLQHYERLQKEADELEEAAAATSEEEKEELRASRDRLIEVDQEIEERKRMLASLQRDVEEQDNLAEAYDEGKAECLAAIQEAERVKASCRGFTLDEVQSLRASVSELEQKTGWIITSASGSNLTMTYRNTLQLFFNTSSFRLHPTSKSAIKSDNSPISLTYIGASHDNRRPEALTTEKRFFLQLMRAQLQCLEQSTTSIKSLVDFVSRGWDTATRVAEQTRRLGLEHMVSTHILSDERLGIKIDVLLPKVETKVRIALQLNATTSGAEEGTLEVKTEMEVKANVVYGEAYNEKNMSEFVSKRARAAEFEGWDESIRDLKGRLVATGRKGR